ncbi:MAG: amidohydrolase family protein [Burkholderiaceae bacterium]
MSAIPIVDAHHHLWDLDAGPLRYPWLQDPTPHPFFLGDYAPIRRTYLPDHYRRDSAGLNIVATVHVEAECDRRQQLEETRWLAAVAERDGMPDAIVAHAWFHTPESAAVLEAQAAHPLVRGIRSKPVTSASPRESVAGQPGSMQDPAWRAGFARLRGLGLSWDLRVPAWHLNEAAQVCAGQPDIPVVLNHTGFPWDRSAEGLAIWRAGMRALAALEHVHCKLSCLCLPDGPWDAASNRDIVRETIELFGIERCMFASNFPVDGLRVGFARMFADFERMTDDLSLNDRKRLFHDNAARFYRIETGHE